MNPLALLLTLTLAACTVTNRAPSGAKITAHGAEHIDIFARVDLGPKDLPLLLLREAPVRQCLRQFLRGEVEVAGVFRTRGFTRLEVLTADAELRACLVAALNREVPGVVGEVRWTWSPRPLSGARSLVLPPEPGKKYD